MCLELDPPLGERPGTLARRRFFISLHLHLSLCLPLSPTLAQTLSSFRPRSILPPYLSLFLSPFLRFSLPLPPSSSIPFLFSSFANTERSLPRPLLELRHQTPQGVYAPGHKWNAATPACRPVLRGFSIPTGTSAMWLRAALPSFATCPPSSPSYSYHARFFLPSFLPSILSFSASLPLFASSPLPC